MPLNIIKGDIFTSKCDYLVCPVNCVGVMGKGLALQFKQKFPNCEHFYRKECGLIPSQHPNTLQDIGDYAYCQNVVFFATKKHWRNKSDIKAIQSSLQSFLMLQDYSYAFPALGCGEGGLNWLNIKAMFEQIFIDCENLIELYES